MILFFYGPNTYEARQQIARLVAQYKQRTGGDLGIERIDGAKVAAGDLRNSLQATPFLASSRLVIVEDLGSNKSLASKIDGLLEGIPATTVAVFYDPNVDQRTTYFKTLKGKAKAVAFEPLTAPKLQQWVQRRASELGGSIDRPALGRLLELAGEDQWRLSNEIAKLVNFSPQITVATVDEQVESTGAESIFNLVEAMTAGKRQQALKLYHRLRQEGQNEIYILSMVTWQLRNLLIAKSAGKITPPQLAKQAGMSPYVAGKMLSKRHLYAEEQLQQAFLMAVETDYRIKSGAASGDILVERLILDLASLVTQASS